MNINELKYKAYHCAVAHGWHEEERSNEHFLCLVISELMEAVEADRKGRHANREQFDYYMSLKERSDDEFIYAFKHGIKDSVEDELADSCIRILDYCGTINFVIDDSCLRSEVIEEFASIFKDKTFTESIFNIVTSITKFEIQISLLKLFGFAKHLGINLDWHVTKKMRYNQIREYRHGNMKY